MSESKPVPLYVLALIVTAVLALAAVALRDTFIGIAITDAVTGTVRTPNVCKCPTCGHLYNRVEPESPFFNCGKCGAFHWVTPDIIFEASRVATEPTPQASRSR